MSDITLKPIRSGYNLSKINQNFETIEDVINGEIVHTTGGNNTMNQQLDMDSNRIINVKYPEDGVDAANRNYVDARVSSLAGGGISQDIDFRIWGDRFKGVFKDGFTYTNSSDVGRGQDGRYYSYLGEVFPFTVTKGTVPSLEPLVYEERNPSLSDSSVDNNGGTVQDHLDSLFSNRIEATRYIKDYSNPTDSELDFLMSCGKLVMWEAGIINTGKTISFVGDTIWKAVKSGTVTFKANHSGRVLYTTGNAGICGTIGINFDGNFIAEELVRYEGCGRVVAEEGKGSNIVMTNDASKNYRGAWMFIGIQHLQFGNLEAENIEQNTPAGFSHGQHHAFAFNNIYSVSNTGSCTADNVDKLVSTAEYTCGGYYGTFFGTNINDNVSYFLGTPDGGIFNLYGENYQEAVVYNPTTTDSAIFIPYGNFKNGSSRVIALRSGGGLKIGKLVSKGSRSGIVDRNFSGSVGCQIEDCYLEDVQEEFAMDLLNSQVTINRFKALGVDSTLWDEVARIQQAANVKVSLFEANGGAAATAIRFNELTTGSVYIESLVTDKTPTVYQASVDFGGKVGINKINGFEIEGNAPAPLTISSGSITITSSYHRVDTEGGASSDGIDNIFGAPSVGTVLTLQSLSNVRDPILVHGTGNIRLPNSTDIRLNASYESIRLRWDGTYWSPSL